ncbi:MAG: hypothetical protein CL454_08955 [Acidimicrobiaceae bacterium]|nr:MAG: hypothetical protein MB53_02305 [marine actinobacterium MedAcidi-G2A]MBA4811195.1 hypothetical protein [Acidimicrobiales bacterium]MBC84972.1 hypothetical protein [Acidimicrobiaceae bacterium]|tara:strand:+ start:81434 stop:81925 length:492 start_codon:yes stop_codon:yes gene_type:complete
MDNTQSDNDKTRSLFSRLIGPLLLTMGICGVILGFALSSQGSSDIRVEGNPIIESLLPEPDSEVLRQSFVGIDLISGYEAELTINGVPIPPDEINVLRDLENPRESAETSGSFGSTLNRFLYQPLEGRAVPELLGDRNCVSAVYWPLSDPEKRQRIDWCFTAL